MKNEDRSKKSLIKVVFLAMSIFILFVSPMYVQAANKISADKNYKKAPVMKKKEIYLVGEDIL